MRLPIALFLLLVGCQAARVSSPANVATGNHVTTAKVLAGEAKSNVEAAKPYTSGVGTVHLLNAGVQLSRVDSELGAALASNGKSDQEVAALTKQVVSQQAKLDLYKSRWLGDKSLRLIYWIVVAWVVLGLASAVVSVYFPGGWVGAIGRQILGAVPLSQLFTGLVGLVKR